MPKVSVIIPCFNQGRMLDDAVTSVLQQEYTDYEIIIVNDGSTDPDSQKILQHYQRPKTRVIHTANMGLASARNNGIAEANGRYILPLDADDRIEQGYLEKASAILDSEPATGIVYCRARLFGAVETEWLLPEYSLSEMLKDNLIFCTAMFRRSDWELVGGYDAGMIYGWEDYDFWLSLIETGRGVVQIPEILFSYRVASDSMVRSKEKWQKIEMFRRIYQKHQRLFSRHIDVWIDTVVTSREKYYTSRLYVDSGNGISDSASISRKVEKTSSEIVFDLSSYDKICSLRFDPVDVPAVVEIFKVEFKYADEQIFEQKIVSDNALLKDGADRLFATDDPQCFFNISPERLSGLSTVSVKLSFKALEQDALQLIIEKLSQERSAMFDKLDCLERRGAVPAFIKNLSRRQSERVSCYLKRQIGLSR